MNDNLTRLDVETKVALMAALLYDQNNTGLKGGAAAYAVAVAIEIEQLAHQRVCETMREKKLART